MKHKKQKLEIINHCLFSYKTYELDLFIYMINKFSEHEDYTDYFKDSKISKVAFNVN